MRRVLLAASLFAACAHVAPSPPRDAVRRQVVARSNPKRPSWVHREAEVIAGKRSFVGTGHAGSLEEARALAEEDLLASIAGVVTATSGTVVRGVEMDAVYWERFSSPLAEGGDIHQVFVRGWAQKTELVRARYLVRQRRHEATGRTLVAVLPFDGAPHWRLAITDAVSRSLDVMDKVETVDAPVLRRIAPSGTGDPQAIARVRRALMPDFVVTGGFTIVAGRLRLTLVLWDAEGKAVGVIAFGRPRQQISGALLSATRRLASRILNRSPQGGLRISSKALEHRGHAAALLAEGDPEEALKRAFAAIDAASKNVEGWMIAARVLERLERSAAFDQALAPRELETCTESARAALVSAGSTPLDRSGTPEDGTDLHRFAAAIVDLVSAAPWKGRHVPLKRHDKLRRSPSGATRLRVEQDATAKVLEEDTSRRWLRLRIEGSKGPVEGWYSKGRILRRIVPKPPSARPATAAEAYYAAFRAARGSDPKRFSAALEMARMAASRGRHDLARVLYRAVAQAFPSLELRARALLGFARTEARLGRLEEARGALVRARALALTLGATVHVFEMDRLLARVHAARGDRAQALSLLRPLIAMAEKLDDRTGAAEVRAEVGALLASAGDSAIAEDLLRRAHQSSPSATTAISLATVSSRRGEVERAERLLAGVNEARASALLRAALARTRGVAAVRRGRAGQGIGDLARAAAIYRRLEDLRFGPTVVDLHEAELVSAGGREGVRQCVLRRLRAFGAPSAGLVAALVAETPAVATASTASVTHALEVLVAEPTAPIALSPKRLRRWHEPTRTADARAELELAISRLAEQEEPIREAHALLNLGQLLWLEGRHDESYRALMRAKETYARADDLFGVALTLRWLGTLFEESGAADLAARHRALARRLTD